MREAKNRRLLSEPYVTDGNNRDANKDYNDEHNRDVIDDDDDDDRPEVQYHCYIIAGVLRILCYRFVAC